MELAKIELRLSAQHTVTKHDVTPPQVAMYAYMHGEDCIQSLLVTGVDKSRQVPAELNRLRTEFTSEYATKCLNTLFPGRFPHLPTTFVAMGFDPAMLAPADAPPPTVSVQAKNQSEAAIMQKIREAAEARKAVGDAPTIVHTDERSDALDDTGDDDEEDEIDDDPLDEELSRLQNEGGAVAPKPKGK